MPSVALVAVTVTVPAEFGATYVAVAAAWALKLPAVADHVTPSGSLVVAMRGIAWVTARPPRFGESETVMPPAERIVSDKLTVFDCCGFPESFTWNVSGVLVTETVGVPAIAPVAAFSCKFAGKLPPVRVQL